MLTFSVITFVVHNVIIFIKSDKLVRVEHELVLCLIVIKTIQISMNFSESQSV